MNCKSPVVNDPIIAQSDKENPFSANAQIKYHAFNDNPR